MSLQMAFRMILVRNPGQLLILPALLILVSYASAQGAHIRVDVPGHVGDNVRLPCTVDTQKCGSLHSIKWYRGSSRIFVFSESANISRADGGYAGRAELQYTPNESTSYLLVKQLQLVDEAVYKCDVTYLEVGDGCAVVQFINLTTLIKPQYVKILRDDSDVQNSTVIGPYTEENELVLECISGNGKPVPTVTWYNGSSPVPGEYSADTGQGGTGIGRSTLRVSLTRGDLGAKFECRSNNAALEDKPMVTWVEVDLNVRPIRMALSGIQQPLVQGATVSIDCTVFNARPPANVSWFNGTSSLEGVEGVEIETHSSVQLNGEDQVQLGAVSTLTYPPTHPDI